MKSSPISLHHFEVCTKDLNFAKLLISGYGFKNWLEKKTKQCHQYVLRSNYCTIIVTNRLHDKENSNKVGNTENIIAGSLNGTYPTLYCCSRLEKHENDALFNVALEVENIQNIMQRIKTNGGQVLQEMEVIDDKFGTLKYAIVIPPCENVIHTLIEKHNYSGFLPGFHPISIQNTTDSMIMMNYTDHVTFVTEEGKSSILLKWYQNVFKMKRLFINKAETEEDGFVLGDMIGLRLKAMQYWRCAETGVSSSSYACPDQLTFVIAEPLPEVKNNHVQKFLDANSGPGVQHIAFHTNSIIDSITILSNAGVKFRMPPYTYYEEIIGRKEIKDAGLEESFDMMQKLGILIDFEESPNSVNYLMQIFSYPVFEKETLFLEVIQRNGANGFGAGNIIALAQSILRYQKEMNKKSLSNGINTHNILPNVNGC